MKGMKKLLEKELERMRKIVQTTNERLEDSPEGSLRITKSNQVVQYYHHKDGDKNNGRYLSKVKEGELIQRLAQKSYDKKVLQLAEKRIKQMNYLAEEYQDDELEEIYQKMSAERRKYVTPVEPTWEQVFDKWDAQKYIGKSFSDGEHLIISEKGDRVRSKSEKIIADYFYWNNIPYKYEKPLYLKGYGTVYPDFTFLSPRTMQEIYWEHEGCMDDSVYVNNAIKKLKLYEENGIYMGERLILTFETKSQVISMSDVEKKVNRYLR